MLVSLAQVEPLLRCPRTGVALVREGEGFHCIDDRGCRYETVQGTPVLVDFARSILSPEQVAQSGAGSPIQRERRRGVARMLKGMLSPEKKGTRDNIERFIAGLPRGRQALVLVIGGGTVGQGMQALYEHPDVSIVAFDIYCSPDVQFVADAHSIPLAEGSVDAVVIQAVLEHVLDPQKVVDEIWRVLKPGGLVYAETPFLQHVHEGAYDFTRFTESGHRFLFRRFDLLDSGVSGGPGTQLLWSIDYFVRGVFRSRAIGKMFKLAFSWLHWFDALVPASYASDAASGVYFLGRRSEVALAPQDVIAFYRGAQRAPA